MSTELHPASTASVAAFVGIVAAVIICFLAGVHHAYRMEYRRGPRITLWTAMAILAWLATLSGLVAGGHLAALPLQGIPVFFGGVTAVSVAVGFSPLGGKLAATLPLAALVAFQIFRLPLELVLHSWGTQGTIPLSMTWRGQNWDIVSGIVALLAAPFANRHRSVAWLANVVGLGLLLNVMRVALMSAPVPFGWQTNPPLLLAFHLPYALIGPVCVGGALMGHIVLTRALLRRTDITSEPTGKAPVPSPMNHRGSGRSAGRFLRL